MLHLRDTLAAGVPKRKVPGNKNVRNLLKRSSPVSKKETFSSFLPDVYALGSSQTTLVEWRVGRSTWQMRVRFKTLHLGNSWNNMLFTLIEEDFSSLELSLRQDSLILNRWTWDTCSILLLIKHLPSIALIYKLFTLKRLEALKVNSSYGLSKS